MNALGVNLAVSWLPAGGWERFAVDALWQSTALAGAGLILSLLVRRRAAVRAAILLAAAVLSVAVPVLSSAVRATGSGLLSAPRETSRVIAHAERAEPAVNVPERGAFELPQDALPAVEPTPIVKAAKAAPVPWRVWPVLAGLWLAASGLLAWRVLRSWIRVRRVIRSAESCADPALSVALGKAAEALAVTPPPLLRSAEFETPALVTLARPWLLVPPRMPSGVDWFAVFCHELAHLARRDGESRLAIELCLVLLPWQPLLWLTRRQFRAACEEACDDWAIASGADPIELASLLVALVPQRQPALALGMAESPAATRQRILRLLAMKGAVHPQLGLALGIVGWMLATGLAVSLAMLQFGRPASPVASGSRSSPDAAGPSGAPPWGDESLSAAIAQAAAALPKTSGRPAPYVIQPPDVLQISILKLVPRPPYRVEPEDVLQIVVANPLIDQPINGPYEVDVDGEISLGPAYGSIKVSGLTLPEVREVIENQLKHILRDPQIQATLAKVSSLPPLSGERLVAPDGTINLGTYGIVYVAGKTIGQATDAIEAQLGKKLERPQVSLEVYSYNSKSYYLVIEAPEGDQLVRVPYTGGETVLDALVKGMADRKLADPTDYWVWVARPVDTSPAPPERTSKREVLTTVDGVVEEVLVEYGQQVKQGDVLVRLSNAELEESIAEAEASLALTPPDANGGEGLPKTLGEEQENRRPSIKLVAQRRSAESKSGEPRESDAAEPDPELSELFPGDDPPPPPSADYDVDDAPPEPGAAGAEEMPQEAQPEKRFYSYDELEAMKKKRERLTITSPIDGTVSTPRLRQRLLHQAVRQGQVLLAIAEVDDDAEPAARAPEPADRRDHILPVDWQAVVAGTSTTSNWQLKSGDRIFIRQKPKR